MTRLLRTDLIREGEFLNRWFKSRVINKNQNVIIAFTGSTGCISKDSIIRVNRMKGTRQYTIEELFNYYHNPKVNKNSKVFDTSIPAFVRSYDGDKIKLHRLKDVTFSGLNKVYKLILEDGKNIKATAEHKFLTSNGWKELINLANEDIILVDTPKPLKDSRKRIKLRDIQLKVDYHPFSNPHNKQVEVHRLIYEARLNNLDFLEYIDILLNEPDSSKELKFVDTNLYVVHHKDGFHYNNSIDNLELMPIEEHLKLHGESNYSNFSQGIIKYVKIKQIIEIGIEPTYDIECEEPYHNFVANDIIIHNSGKTYSSLSGSEQWYDYNFKEKFPVDNVCFGLSELARRIDYLHKNKLLRRGEVFLLEEAGANFSNLDFQNKLSKMFGFILQSFRSMNLILILTLPVLTMVNKTARQLIHAHFITSGIDYNTKISKVKPYFHQLNQSSGKSYWKYPRVRVNGKVITLHRLKFRLPSEDLIKTYEIKKGEFVFNLTSEFIKQSDKMDRDNLLKSQRPRLTNLELGVLDRLKDGQSIPQIAEGKGVSKKRIYYMVQNIYKKGYDTKQYLKNSKTQEMNIDELHKP